MEITEVRVKLVGSRSERLRAFCSITLDGDFVIRDLKVIDGVNGAFVAMPSRKLSDRCRGCGAKNHLRAKFCGECGAKLPENRAPKDSHGRAKLHADVAHPINTACRERIQATVVQAYTEELERSKEPDYQPLDYDEDYDDFEEEPTPTSPNRPQADTEPPLDEEDEEGEEELGAPTSTGDSEYDSLISDLKRAAAVRRGGDGSTQSEDDETDVREVREPTRESSRESGGRSERDERPSRRGRRGRSRAPREADAEREPADRPAPAVAEPAVAEPAVVESRAGESEAEETAPEPAPDRLADFGAGIL